MKNETVKHTPGPWRWTGRYNPTVEKSDQTKRICETLDHSPEDYANAQLISSAPELLECLRDAVDNLHAEGFDNDPKDGGNPVMMAEFRAVIAKAEGQ